MSEGEPRQKHELLAAFSNMTGAPTLASEDNDVCLPVFDGCTRINLLSFCRRLATGGLRG